MAVLRSKIFIVLAIIAALVGLYALLGFKLAPKLVRSQAIEFVRTTYGRELKVGEVRVQPFKLQLEVRDLAFPDDDGQTMLGFERLFADFELSSLWKRAWYFRDVQLDAPVVRAVVRPQGALNLGDLAIEEPPGTHRRNRSRCPVSGSPRWMSAKASSILWTARAAARSSVASAPWRSASRNSVRRRRAVIFG
jgi:hypothetical protein